MSGPLTINDGGLALKDPNDIAVYEFDWDAEHLAASVTIASFTVTGTAVKPSTATVPTLDVASSGLGLQAGSRKVKVKVSGGTLGARYRITCQIVTNETPAQTKERSFFLKLDNL